MTKSESIGKEGIDWKQMNSDVQGKNLDAVSEKGVLDVKLFLFEVKAHIEQLFGFDELFLM